MKHLVNHKNTNDYKLTLLFRPIVFGNIPVPSALLSESFYDAPGWKNQEFDGAEKGESVLRVTELDRT
jgi:hypothetical protein